MERTPHVALDFKQLDPAGKVIFGRNVNLKMTDAVAIFPAPDVPLDNIDLLTEALAGAIQQAEGGDHEKIAARNRLEKAWDTMMTTEAHYVDRIAVGVRDTILLSGFNTTASETSPSAVTPAPTNVKGVTSLTIPGGAHVQCDVLKGAMAYLYIFATTSDPVSVTDGYFTLADNAHVIATATDTHNKIDVTGLPSRQTIYVTIIGINRKGSGAANSPVSFRTL